MTGLGLLVPEAALAAVALGLMLAESMLSGRSARLVTLLGAAGSLAALGLVARSLAFPLDLQGLGTLWSVDPMSQFFKALVLAATVAALLLSLGYGQVPERHAGTFTAMVLFATLGLMLLSSANDLLLILVALELVSIASFILAGFERADAKSNEGAIKYFLFGAFSSAVMIFGISLYYGATGSTSLLAQPAPGAVTALALLFILAGFGFKASIAPMHFWVPDAYEGAPTPVTAYLSVAPKVATLAAILRVFVLLVPAKDFGLTTLLTILAGLTMTIGNFTALFQTNVKRLLAYSSVAQAGYMMIGIVVADPMGLEGVMLYGAVYAAMNMGAFAVAVAVGEESGYGLEAFDGLARRSLGTALAMTVFMLSLAGLPPLAGFVGKFYIFAAAMRSGYYGLAVLGVVNSVVSVYYYVGLVYHMFLRPARVEAPLPLAWPLRATLAAALAAVLVLGIYPEPLIAGVQAWAQTVP